MVNRKERADMETLTCQLEPVNDIVFILQERLGLIVCGSSALHLFPYRQPGFQPRVIVTTPQVLK